MTTPLSDQQLIELVQEKTPDELSYEEIEQLRERLSQSPELREMLYEQLQLESYLGAALGRFRVSIDAIVSASGPDDRVGWFGNWRLNLLLLFGLCSLGGLALFLSPRKPPERIVARTDQKDKEEEEQSNAENEKPKPKTNEAVPAVPTAWRVALEAERFARGNLMVEMLPGDAGTVVRSGEQRPSFAEYEVLVPAAGQYRLESRYASDRPRPVKLSINGAVVKERAADQSTVVAGNESHDPRDFVEGVFPLVAGNNVLRLETSGEFPNLDRLMLEQIGGMSTTDPMPETVVATTTPSATTPQAPPEPAKGPWDATLDAAPSAWSFPAALTALHDTAGLNKASLHQWFAPVPKYPHQFHEGKRGNANVGGLEGVVKLLAPWPEDGVLHLPLFEHDRLKLHLWNQREGISLCYIQGPKPTWVAYQTQRPDDRVLPERMVLAGTDDGRYERTGAGPIELRWQKGQLILSRGDVRLLTVPFASAPAEVYFDGRLWLSGIRMTHGLPFPDDPVPEHAVVLESQEPAKLNWVGMLPEGATSTAKDDGRLELNANGNKQIAALGVLLEEPKLCEIVVQFDSVTPGAGLFLGDAQGKPQQQLGFFRDNATGRTSFGFLHPGEIRLVANADPTYQIAPYAADKPWLKLVLGHGSCKCWVSPDGIHWSRALDPLRSVKGGFAQVGLFCLPGDGARSVSLRSLSIRELTGLTSIVPRELQARAAKLPGDLELEAWLQQALTSQPADADPVEWRQACALRTLAGGAWGDLGRMLIAGLASDVLAQNIPVERRLQFLNDVALIYDTWEHPDGTRFVSYYEELGRNLVREEQAQPFTPVLDGLVRAPFFTLAPVHAFPEQLIRQELANSVYGENWEAAWNVCDRVRYWNTASLFDQPWPAGREPTRKLIEWGEAWASRATPNRRTTDTIATTWRHPLIEELSKEGYNILAEFDAALSGDAFKDACQIITSAGTTETLGLLPDAKDRRLLVSLPRAVSLAMREQPQLRQTMISTFGPVGRLRVRQAMAEGDVDAVQAATVQFTGTDAAGEAHLWLGDRALSGGRFAQAIGQYQQALSTVSPADRAVTAAKLRLAHSLRGEDSGQPITQPIEIGNVKMTADEFERLVAEMRESRSHQGSLQNPGGQPQKARNAPPPSAYNVGRRLGFDGQFGHSAGQTVYPGLDAAGQQYSLVLADPLLLAGNRFELCAYDLGNGQRKWTHNLGGEMGDARAWALVNMPPVVAGDRLYVRRLTRQGPDVACLETSTGKLVWARRPGEFAASDPLVFQDDLRVLSVDTPQSGLLQVSLTTLDPRTGEILGQEPLVQLRDVWNRHLPCHAVASDDKIVATIGGSILCCDLLGNALWLRRQTWAPNQAEAHPWFLYRQSPVVAGNRVYVLQPGVMSLDCLDLDSGRLHWQRVLPTVRRMAGIVDGVLLVETNAGFEGIDPGTGHSQWRRDEPRRILTAQLAGEPGGLLYACAEPVVGEISRPRLVWLNPRTGAVTAEALLNLAPLVEKMPMLGPAVVQGDRIWLAIGHNDHDPRREFVELLPAGPALAGSAADVALEHWTRDVVEPVPTQVAETFPGWTLLTRQYDRGYGYRFDFEGERDVFLLQATAQRPVSWAQRIDLKQGTRRKLAVRVASDPARVQQLVVRVNDQKVLDAPLDAKAGRWQTFEADLSKFAGNSVWVVATAGPAEAGPFHVGWKRLELVD